MGNILNSEMFLSFLKMAILCSSFASLFYLALFLTPDEKKEAARKKLGVGDELDRSNQTFLLKLSRPLIQVLLPWTQKRTSDEERKVLHKKLLSANLRDELTPDEFVAFRTLMTVLLGLMTLYLFGAMGNPLPFTLWPLLFVATYYAANLWLSQRIEMRRRMIVRALPYAMDLLTLSVEAGLDFVASIQRVSQKTENNALMVEFNHMLREIRLGTSRSDALRSLSGPLQIEEISSFTTLLIQADQLGAPIGNVLRAQSDQLRTRRFQAAEAAGAKASQLILFPLVLCIFPAIFIVVLGPTIIGFLQKGLF